MDVIAPVLLRGAWYSLEQCGRLLSDAIVLYREKSYSSAVALAMIGREELGKHGMLLDEWRKSEGTGKYPTVDSIQTSAHHVHKQRRALLGLTFTTENTSALGTAIRTQMKHKPQDTEYQQAEKVIQTALKSLAKRAPDDRHAARIRALYVDLQDSGSDWSRPSEVSRDDAKKLLSDAANDYAGQRNRLNPDLVRALGDPKLADALEAWHERPALPEPVWPEW
jgi:AbiV family abortive infection protein